jgi:hypothetical protein
MPRSGGAGLGAADEPISGMTQARDEAGVPVYRAVAV